MLVPGSLVSKARTEFVYVEFAHDTVLHGTTQNSQMGTIGITIAVIKQRNHYAFYNIWANGSIGWNWDDQVEQA
jgi:hypothetical protein